MTNETKMDTMDTIYWSIKNKLCECENLLQYNEERMPMSWKEQKMIDIQFYGIKQMVELSEKCWNESKKQKEVK